MSKENCFFLGLEFQPVQIFHMLGDGNDSIIHTLIVKNWCQLLDDEVEYKGCPQEPQLLTTFIEKIMLNAINQQVTLIYVQFQ